MFQGKPMCQSPFSGLRESVSSFLHEQQYIPHRQQNPLLFGRRCRRHNHLIFLFLDDSRQQLPLPPKWFPQFLLFQKRKGGRNPGKEQSLEQILGEVPLPISVLRFPQNIRKQIFLPSFPQRFRHLHCQQSPPVSASRVPLGYRHTPQHSLTSE